MAKLHNNVSTLALKKVWDSTNLKLFLKGSNRFTTSEFMAYWEAVDRTVRYFDSIVLLKKQGKGKNPKNAGNFLNQCQKDRSKWQNPVFNRNTEEDVSLHRKLPPPPRSSTNHRQVYL